MERAGQALGWAATAPLSQVYARLTGKQGQRRGAEVQFLCAFHADTDPSLYINDQKDIGHCFGCEFGFNRYQLLKELGIPVHARRNGHGPRPVPQRELDALKALGRTTEAQKVEACATKAWLRKCRSCGETFVAGQHCDHAVCPTCNYRHAFRFFEAHWGSLEFANEMWGITLALPGVPLSNGNTVQGVVKKATRTLAQFRRKFKAVNIFQNAIVVRQLKVKDGVAWLKLHILADTTRAEVNLFCHWWASRYRWNPIRRTQEFGNLLEAVEWLQDKAAHPLEWETQEDLAAYLGGMRHTPIVYGLGRFRKVRGGRGQGKAVKQARKKPACPFCSSEDIASLGTIPWAEAWRYDKRYAPPAQAPPAQGP